MRVLILLLLVFAVSPIVSSVSATPVYAADFTVSVSSSKDLGKFLVGKDGMTLYSFTVDPLNETMCYDKCETAWPPLTVASADELKVADGIPGKFATITRKDGSLQVTYNGIALYYWFKDNKAGDTTGHRVGRVWWVVPPATAYLQKIPKLGSVLVGPTGMTLYTFTKDTTDVSNCNDKCAVAWPALTVKSADEFVPGINLPGKFNTITRKDSTLQVTYNGMPLYYYQDDKAIGDATGENVGKVWFTVVPETITTASNKDLGDLLTTTDGITLYASAKDAAGVSNCTGDCLKNWPAFTVGANDRLAAGSLKGKLETLKRDDNTLQVTYNGAPLYFFAKDKAPGDVLGQAVGNGWSVIKP
ncbi:MAG: hypothetical protein ABI947_16355 [Chloroflexota bacterium]